MANLSILLCVYFGLLSVLAVIYSALKLYLRKREGDLFKRFKNLGMSGPKIEQMIEANTKNLRWWLEFVREVSSMFKFWSG